MPAKQSRQLALYDLIAQRFIPGVRYTELEVNRELMQLYDDYVTLRRGLIDFGLMDRADGQYWRSGGTVPHAGPPAGDGPRPSARPISAAGRGPPGGDPDRRRPSCSPTTVTRRSGWTTSAPRPA